MRTHLAGRDKLQPKSGCAGENLNLIIEGVSKADQTGEGATAAVTAMFGTKALCEVPLAPALQKRLFCSWLGKLVLFIPSQQCHAGKRRPCKKVYL